MRDIIADGLRDIYGGDNTARRQRHALLYQVHHLDVRSTLGNHRLEGVGSTWLEERLQNTYSPGENNTRWQELRSCLDVSLHWGRRLVSALRLLRERQPLVSEGVAEHPVMVEWLGASGWHGVVAEACDLAIAQGACLVRVAAEPETLVHLLPAQCATVLPMPGYPTRMGCLVEHGEADTTVWDVRDPERPIALRVMGKRVTAEQWRGTTTHGVVWRMEGPAYAPRVGGKPAIPAVLYRDPHLSSSLGLLPCQRDIDTITAQELLASTHIRWLTADQPTKQPLVASQNAVMPAPGGAPAPGRVQGITGFNGSTDELIITPGAMDDVVKLRADQVARVQSAAIAYIGSSALEAAPRPESGLALTLRENEKRGEFNTQEQAWAPVDLALLRTVGAVALGDDLARSLGDPAVAYAMTTTPQQQAEEVKAILERVKLGLAEPAEVIVALQGCTLVEARTRHQEIREAISAAGFAPTPQGVIYQGVTTDPAPDLPPSWNLLGLQELINGWRSGSMQTSDAQWMLRHVFPFTPEQVQELFAAPAEERAPTPQEARYVPTPEMANIAAEALQKPGVRDLVTPADMRWGYDIRARTPLSPGRLRELATWHTAHAGEQEGYAGRLRGGMPGALWAAEQQQAMDAPPMPATPAALVAFRPGTKETIDGKRVWTLLEGLRVVIEYDVGEVRSGTAPDGTTWEREMVAPYGYILDAPAPGDPSRRVQIIGTDKEPLDVFIARADNERVWVIDQLREDGFLDEQKLVLGALSAEEARAVYLAHYPAGWESRILPDVGQHTIRGLIARAASQREGWPVRRG